MTVWEVLAVVAVAWVLIVGTGWVSFVAVARWRTLTAIDARKRLAIERGVAMQETLLGAIGEGAHEGVGEAGEAFREQVAAERSRFTRQHGAVPR
jgi:hypothetical protein